MYEACIFIILCPLVLPPLNKIIAVWTFQPNKDKGSE